LQEASEAAREDINRHATRLDENLAVILRHNDSLFARVDQKLDLYRGESRRLWGHLGAALAELESTGPVPLARARDEYAYLELEHFHRGTEEEISDRLEPYLGYLEGRQRVLDLGCGRGEALELLRERGIEARGVDSNEQMVAICAEKGLQVERGDLFAVLAKVAPGSLDGIVSFHVIEHLPPVELDRLTRLAWRALEPGGVLIFETPNPLSIVVAARNFWLDPTHHRPVHPESLKLLYELAGFDEVERLDLRPFLDTDRLAAVDVTRLPQELHPLADQINALRDQLDELLFGAQDYAMVGVKPAAADTAQGAEGD
jgi:SAM-dependent methyltransferase